MWVLVCGMCMVAAGNFKWNFHSQTKATLLSARSICATYYQCVCVCVCVFLIQVRDVNLCSAWIFSPFFISRDTDNEKEMVKWENALQPQITETREKKKKLAIKIIMYLLASCLCGCCVLCAIKWMWTDLCYVWRLFSDHHPFF